MQSPSFHRSVPSTSLWQRSVSGQLLIGCEVPTRAFILNSYWIRGPHRAKQIWSFLGIRGTRNPLPWMALPFATSPQFPLPFSLHFIHPQPGSVRINMLLEKQQVFSALPPMCLVSGPTQQGDFRSRGSWLGCLCAHFLGTSSWTPSWIPSLSFLPGPGASPLLPTNVSSLHCVSSLEAQSRDQCPFCFWIYTVSTWATLSQSWKNWTDVPVAPNQSQPQPCLVLLLSLYWVVLSPCHWGILWLFICFASCCLDHLFSPLIVLSLTFLGDAVFF